MRETRLTGLLERIAPVALYLISYNPARFSDARRLHQALRLWTAKRVMKSVWLAELVGPAEKVRNLLLGSIDDRDSLTVIEIEPTAEWAVHHAEPEGLDWLHRHVPGHDRSA